MMHLWTSEQTEALAYFCEEADLTAPKAAIMMTDKFRRKFTRDDIINHCEKTGIKLYGNLWVAPRRKPKDKLVRVKAPPLVPKLGMQRLTKKQKEVQDA
jgi:hypothetical protein